MSHITKHNNLINLHIAKIESEHMDAIGNMVAEFSGIQIGRLLTKHVMREIASQMIKYATEDPDEYISILKTNDGYTFVMNDLISAISVSESYFFRNRGQFEYLYYEFFPQYYENKDNYKSKVKIWSAGCSRGEEPYSAAIMANTFFKTNPIASFKITAGDISNSNLEIARNGVYSPRSIRKGFNGFENIFGTIDGEYDQNGYFSISPNIASYVDFTNFNLKSKKDLQKMNNSDVIMCRNVLIYFDDDFVKKLMETFYECLNPGGLLLLGETEILPKSFSQFVTINYKNSYIFKKAM